MRIERTGRRRLFIVSGWLAVLLSWLPSTGHAQFLWDFETGNYLTTPVSGMGAWTITNTATVTSPNAFTRMPVYGDIPITRVDLRTGFKDDIGATVGGDYWYGPYPIGASGNFWIGTYENRHNSSEEFSAAQGDNPQGIATSPVFKIGRNADGTSNPNRRFLTFLVAGGNAANLSISLQKYGTGTFPACSCTIYQGLCCGDEFPTWGTAKVWEVRNSIAPTNGDGAPRPYPWYLIDAGARGENSERFRQVIWDTWACPRYNILRQVAGYDRECNETDARIVITDASSASWGHINVDRIRLGAYEQVDLEDGADAPLGSKTAHEAGTKNPVWGFADLHTHWVNHLAGSRAQNAYTDGRSLRAYQNMLHGHPWWDTEVNCVDLDRLVAAIPTCDGHHHSNQPSGTRTSASNRVFLDHLSPANAKIQDNPWLTLIAVATWLAPTIPVVGVMVAFPMQMTGSALLVAFGGLGKGSSGPIEPYPENYSHDVYGAQDGTTFKVGRAPYLDTIHQQMYWKWVKRAWEGGLRVLVSDVSEAPAFDLLSHDWQLKSYPGYTGSEYHAGSGCDRSHGRLAYGYAETERVVARRQTCGMRKLVRQPEIAAFAQIAYTAAQARQIIESGKLAVVMGAELDNLNGETDLEPSTVAELWSLGVRKITPVHTIDNMLGGTAVYSELFNTANDAINLVHPYPTKGSRCVTDQSWAGVADDTRYNWMDRPPPGRMHCAGAWDQTWRYPDSYQEWLTGGVPVGNPHSQYPEGTENFEGNVSVSLGSGAYAGWTPLNFFNIEPGCPAGRSTGNGSCSQFGLLHGKPDVQTGQKQLLRTYVQELREWPIIIGSQNHLLLAFQKETIATVTGVDVTPNGDEANAVREYDDYDGHRNQRGHTSDLDSAFGEMQSRGILIDVSHMGEKTMARLIGSAYDTGIDGLAWSSSSCSSSSWNTSGCRRNAYPILATHGVHRFLKTPNVQDDLNTQRPSERDLSDDQLRRLLATGGVVGVGVSGEAVSQTYNTLVKNDCPGSSLTAYQFFEDMATYYPTSYNAMGKALPPYWATRGIGIGSDLNGWSPLPAARFMIDTVTGWSTKNRPCTKDADDGGADLASTVYMQINPSGGGWRNGVYYPLEADSVTDLASEISRSSTIGNAQWQMKRLRPDEATPGMLVRSAIYIAPANVAVAGFDINYHGVANIGMLPDMIQDMVNGAHYGSATANKRKVRERLRTLFRSAEDFVQAWEKAEVICYERGGTSCSTPAPIAVDDDSCDPWERHPSNTEPTCIGRCGGMASDGVHRCDGNDAAGPRAPDYNFECPWSPNTN